MDLKTLCRNCEEQTAEEKRELELDKKCIYIYKYVYVLDICIHIYKGYSYFCPQHMPNISKQPGCSEMGRVVLFLILSRREAKVSRTNLYLMGKDSGFPFNQPIGPWAE